MSATILITGGTGLIGSRLTEILLKSGYQVRYYSRSPRKVKNIKSFAWDPDGQTADPDALDGTDYIIHLAGADVAGKRWTQKRKKEIIQSRTRSAALLKTLLNDHPNQVKAVISASGINYYGHDRGEEWLTEQGATGEGFLSDVTRAWEEEVELLQAPGRRIVILRTGIVLSKKGGALPRLAQPVLFGVGAPLGRGTQYMSWIHIDDLCNIYKYAIEQEKMSGVYNAVAPGPVTNKQFTRQVAKTLHRPLILPFVPSFILKIMVGELAEMVLGGLKVSADRIKTMGFSFEYPDLQNALHKIYNKT